MNKLLAKLPCVVVLIVGWGCDIIPDDAASELPNQADYGGMTFTNADGDTFQASISRDDDDYVVVWENSAGAFKLSQEVASSRVTTLQDKLVAVRHYSASKVQLQSIEITYKGDLFEKIVINSPGSYNIQDAFFYKGSKLDSVARVTTYVSGKVERGFLKDATSFSLDGNTYFGPSHYLFLKVYQHEPDEDASYPEEYFQNIMDENAEAALLYIVEDQYEQLSFHTPSTASQPYVYGSFSRYFMFEALNGKMTYFGTSLQVNDTYNALYLNSFMIIPQKLIYQNLSMLDMLYKDLYSGDRSVGQSNNYYPEVGIKFQIKYSHE